MGVQLQPVAVEPARLEQGEPDPHHDAAVDLAVGTDRVQDRAAVVSRSDVQDDEMASALLDAIRRFAPSAAGVSPDLAVSASTSADVIAL